MQQKKVTSGNVTYIPQAHLALFKSNIYAYMHISLVNYLVKQSNVSTVCVCLSVIKGNSDITGTIALWMNCQMNNFSNKWCLA